MKRAKFSRVHISAIILKGRAVTWVYDSEDQYHWLGGIPWSKLPRKIDPVVFIRLLDANVFTVGFTPVWIDVRAPSSSISFRQIMLEHRWRAWLANLRVVSFNIAQSRISRPIRSNCVQNRRSILNAVRSLVAFLQLSSNQINVHLMRANSNYISNIRDVIGAYS